MRVTINGIYRGEMRLTHTDMAYVALRRFHIAGRYEIQGVMNSDPLLQACQQIAISSTDPSAREIAENAVREATS